MTCTHMHPHCTYNQTLVTEKQLMKKHNHPTSTHHTFTHPSICTYIHTHTLTCTGLAEGMFDFVEIKTVKAVQIRPIGKESHWNCDGELLPENHISIRAHQGLVQVRMGDVGEGAVWFVWFVVCVCVCAWFVCLCWCMQESMLNESLHVLLGRCVVVDIVLGVWFACVYASILCPPCAHCTNIVVVVMQSSPVYTKCCQSSFLVSIGCMWYCMVGV